MLQSGPVLVAIDLVVTEHGNPPSGQVYQLLSFTKTVFLEMVRGEEACSMNTIKYLFNHFNGLTEAV
jgi:hypothetical protein